MNTTTPPTCTHRVLGLLGAFFLFVPLVPIVQANEKGSIQRKAFLNNYCFRCHDSNKQEGDRRFDDLPQSIGTEIAIAERWQEILDQLQLGEMPPDGEKQPTDHERREIISWIEDEVKQAQILSRAKGGHVVHRRLNRIEYLNTIRDLFGFENDFDPTHSFPGDEEMEGFRNNGAALRTSRHHLEQYLRAADEVLAQAYDLADAHGKPEVDDWRDSAENRKGLNDAFGLGVISEENANGPAYIHLSHGLRNQELIFDSKLFLSGLSNQGVRHSGWYEIEIEATAANRHHAYGEDLMNDGLVRYYKELKNYYDPSQPMRLGIGRQVEGIKGNGWRLIPPNIVHTTELPDDRYVTIRSRVWLDRGTVPYLSWIDGPPKGTRTSFISTKLYKFDSSVPKIEQRVWENLALRAERDKLYQHLYRGPEIRVRYWQVKGPIRGEEPHPARSLLFERIAPDEKDIDPTRIRSELCRIASQLFRRNVETREILPYIEAIQKRLDGETVYADAARPIFKAMLCSSEFLFMHEVHSETKAVSPIQFANRLSYFLTAGPPDSILRSYGEKLLFDAETLRRETDRLLDSPRGDRFLRLFTDQWLGLSKLGTMPPAKESFPSYHIDRLEIAMREETWRFVAELIRTDRPVTDLMDADFSYLNAGLARLYGIPDVNGDSLHRVQLPANSQRRGLLGHASVLTITANGVETSPVTRGVWLLDKLFGTPPNPPPPDVPPIEPDIRGSTTIRQQLEKHRNVSACSDCHIKIDPLGFALEAYDPIGRFRTEYANGVAIDTAGNYRGRSMNSPADIRSYLVNHSDLLAHNLTHRLLTYALGRSLGFGDQPTLRSLQREWSERGNTLRELIHLIVNCDLMRQP